jgi:NAD(P)H-dependent flavin oxidoreductase YrpB (nitropropane dioxygenase family)
LLEAQIKRAEQVEPVINAFTDTFYDQALKKAKAAETRYMAPKGRLRKLEGLTVAIKDEMDVKGQRNTQGSLILKDYIATETDPAVERLLQKERELGTNIKFEDVAAEVAGVYPRVMQEGAVDAGAWSCGMVAGLINDIPSCQELIDRIMRDADQLIAQRLEGLRSGTTIAG